MSFKIEQIHAFVSEDANGEEGVCAVKTAQGWLPLVAADPRRLTVLWGWARQLKASAPQTRIKLVRFSTREDLGDVNAPTQPSAQMG